MLQKGKPYLLNGFLLTLPIIIWNVYFTDSLPDFFHNLTVENTPKILFWFENLFRILFFVLTFLTPLNKSTSRKLSAWTLYITGVLLYFTSWLPLLFCSSDAWSKSLLGILAPSITPILWMSGIILLGDRFSFGIPYRKWIAWLVLILFIFFHNASIIWAYLIVKP